MRDKAITGIEPSLPLAAALGTFSELWMTDVCREGEGDFVITAYNKHLL